MDSPFMVKSSKKLCFLRSKKDDFWWCTSKNKKTRCFFVKYHEILRNPRWDLQHLPQEDLGSQKEVLYPDISRWGNLPGEDEFGHVWTNFPMTSCGKKSADPKNPQEKCYGKQLTNWFQLSPFFANLVLTWMVSEIWVSAVLIGPLPMASCFCPIHECSQRFPWSETAIAVFFRRLISLGSLVFAVCNGWLNTSALFLHHLASKYHRPNQIVLCSLTFQIFQGWTWS